MWRIVALNLNWFINFMTAQEFNSNTFDMIVCAVLLFGTIIESFFLIGGIFIAILPVYLVKRRRGRCTLKVFGRVVDLQKETHTDANGGTVTSYARIYEYSVMGSIYRSKSMGGESVEYRDVINSPVTIYVNPNNPTEIYEKGNLSTASIFFAVFGGIMAIGVLPKLINDIVSLINLMCFL